MMMTTTTTISITSSLNSSRLLLQPTTPPSLRSFKNWKRLKKKIGFQEAVISSRRGKGVCRAELVQDAPFAAAIGACILTSLVVPASYQNPDDDDGGGGGGMDTTDARFAVMGIISFIPYFNWMGWVFAWLDSGKQRYLVYAVVYLAPYLRTNLSLSPEESWLPIASILLCIIHIQLEASIKNGDINGIQFSGRALNLFSQSNGREDFNFQRDEEFPKKGSKKKQMDLPSAENIRDEFGDLGTPRKHMGGPHHSNEQRSEVDEQENKTD